MTNEQKHVLLAAASDALTAASGMYLLARSVCGLPDNCYRTSDGWTAISENREYYATSTVAEGIEVALERLAAMKEAKK